MYFFSGDFLLRYVKPRALANLSGQLRGLNGVPLKSVISKM